MILNATFWKDSSERICDISTETPELRVGIVDPTLRTIGILKLEAKVDEGKYILLLHADNEPVLAFMHEKDLPDILIQRDYLITDLRVGKHFVVLLPEAWGKFDVTGYVKTLDGSYVELELSIRKREK